MVGCNIRRDLLETRGGSSSERVQAFGRSRGLGKTRPGLNLERH